MTSEKELGLLERLRDRITRNHDNYLVNPDGPAAADLIEAQRAEIARKDAALARSAEGWANAIEFGIVPPQHRNAAKILGDECRAALIQSDTVGDK